MQDTDYATLPELMAQLAEPLSQELSGSFFIATDDNTSCRFGIVDGEITHCSYQRFHGLAAIKRLQAGIRGKGAFSENKTTFFTARDQVEHKDAVWMLDIRIPEIVVPEAEEPDPAMDDSDVTTRIYRGQVITEPKAEAEPGTESVKKPPRMYRGQRLDD